MFGDQSGEELHTIAEVFSWGAAMNELTWRKVQQWEALHPETQSEATLLRFCGRPDDLR